MRARKIARPGAGHRHCIAWRGRRRGHVGALARPPGRSL